MKWSWAAQLWNLGGNGKMQLKRCPLVGRGSSSPGCDGYRSKRLSSGKKQTKWTSFSGGRDYQNEQCKLHWEVPPKKHPNSVPSFLDKNDIPRWIIVYGSSPGCAARNCLGLTELRCVFPGGRKSLIALQLESFLKGQKAWLGISCTQVVGERDNLESKFEKTAQVAWPLGR